MKKLYSAIMLAGTFLLSACNGSSGENTTQTTSSTAITSSVTIAMLNAQGQAQQSFSTSDQVTLVVTVLDQNNSAISGRAVSFEADIGELSLPSKLTDSQGEARITITNDGGAVGAGSVTATADETSVSIDYEFLFSNNGIAPIISSEMRLDGSLVNQFKADEQVQIITTFTDSNNLPIADEIITFSADKGLLLADTALTNAQGIATATLIGNDDLGAGILVASIASSSEIKPNRINYEIISSDAVSTEDEIRIGHFDGNTFIEGVIGLSVPTKNISAGGTIGLVVDLVDNNNQRISTSTPVTFTSSCVQSESATIDGAVFSIKGIANSTFEDINCAGVNGTDDVLVASITINGITKTASETIAISGEALGSIEFVSAEPTSIVLKGTGGQGKQETSILTYQVKSSLGNPLAQQTVDFVLDTNAGGIEITPSSGLTNSQGFITTIVKAGTVPTAVRVTAKSSMTIDNEEIVVQTQSDLLSINTGLPEQSSMTLSTTNTNPEAFDISGQEVDITARLADNFNNPVPDGTTVNFTTEGGVIESTCATINGACSVTWTSANPRPADHKITILAFASGHETFFESNGNNVFDSEDGNAIENENVSSGRERITPMASGFIDMSEAWRDDNDNNEYDDGERFIDFNNDGAFSAPDGLFNGPQCSGALCAPEGQNEIHVRKSINMIMASSGAFYLLENSTTGTDYENNQNSTSVSLPNIADGSSLGLTLTVTDTANKTMPRDTVISVSASAGTLIGITSATVTSAIDSPAILEFAIVNPIAGNAEEGFLTINITTPSGVTTSFIKGYDLL